MTQASRTFSLILSALLPLAAAVASAQNSGGRMQTVVLNDVSLGMPAMNLTIPAGWHFQGDVVRNVSCSPGDAFAEYRVTSPDGSIVATMMTPFFTVYPPQMAANINLRGCGMVMQAPPAGRLLSNYIVPQMRQGAQASAPEAVPGIEPLLRSLSGRGNMMTNTAAAARVRLQRMENGRQVEEYIVGLTRYTQFQGAPGGTSQTIVFTISAPPGKLDEFVNGPYSKMVLTNDPQWEQRSATLTAQQTQQIQQNGAATRQGIANQAQQNMQNTVDRSNQTVQNIQRTGEISRQTAAQKQQAIDNAAVGTAGYVGDKTVLYHWQQQSTGKTIYTQKPTAPGPGWVQIN